MCTANNADWYYTLPSVLLGLRTAIRLDTGLSPAEMLFGQSWRIPGDFCDLSNPEIEPGTFMNEYKRYLKKVKPVPVPHKGKTNPDTPFYYQDLDSCTHVWKLVKKVKPPLTRPYSGPYRVISRHTTQKHFKIEIKGKPKVVSTSLLKPVHLSKNFSTISTEPLNPYKPPSPKISLQPKQKNLQNPLILLTNPFLTPFKLSPAQLNFPE